LSEATENKIVLENISAHDKVKGLGKSQNEVAQNLYPSDYFAGTCRVRMSEAASVI
jgi:hypothetical protein